MSERAPFNSPEIQRGYAVNNSVEQQLGSLVIELFTSPRVEIVEMAYPVQALKDWKRQ